MLKKAGIWCCRLKYDKIDLDKEEVNSAAHQQVKKWNVLVDMSCIYFSGGQSIDYLI
jgi:hypothetical protein